MAFLDDAGLVKLWQHIQTRLSNKVDKVAGKGLSSNDFTDEDKEKLASLKKSAQSDWNVNDENDSAYVKNRTHYDSHQEAYKLDNYSFTIPEGETYHDASAEYFLLNMNNTYSLIYNDEASEVAQPLLNMATSDGVRKNWMSYQAFGIELRTQNGNELHIYTAPGSYTISVIEYSGTLKQLDPKFISDSIARVEDMILPGEETTTETIESMDIHVDTADTAYDSEKLGGVLAEEYALKSDLENIDINSMIVLKRVQATVPANGWAQQSTGRYTQTVQVSDLTSHSVCHHADVDMSGATEETAVGIKQAWSMIDNIETTDAGVVFTSFTEAPQVDFNVYIDIEEFIETVPNANGVIF